MKRKLAIILAAVLTLGLIGCAGGNAGGGTEEPAAQSEPAAQNTQTPSGGGAEPETESAVWRYEVEIVSDEQKFTADDGTVIATKKSQTPRLTLKREGGSAADEPPKGMRAVCDAFNEGTGTPMLWDVDIEADAREQYEWKKQEGIEFMELADESEVAGVYQHGDLLSVLGQCYVNLGGAHPDWGYVSWNFDLGTGSFFTPALLSDRSGEMCAAVSDEIVYEIYGTEWYEGYYDNFSEIVRMLTDYDAFFNEKGMTVYFQEYELAPRALGVLEFTIPYAKLGRFLNEDGKRILALSPEDAALADFYEADEMWNWFEGAVPQDDADRRELHIDGADGGWEMDYYRVTIPGVTTLAALKERLAARFSDELIERRFNTGEYDMFREFDGVLYALPAGRGDNLMVDSVEYSVRMDADGKGGKVIASIQWQDYDDVKGEWVLTEKTEKELPFAVTESGARFSDFVSVW
ncbi:MAG: DUF3298 domain-containing protein [Oscillospiraceae bacterium]|nr:DUF3298 domain-containing protein [Oscillospiraceae bacterium]